MVKKTQKNNKKVKKNTVSNTSKIKELNKNIDILNGKLNKAEDQYLRLMADFENFKKRSDRNMIESHKSSIEKIVCSFLPVVDDIQRILNDKNFLIIQCILNLWWHIIFIMFS